MAEVVMVNSDLNPEDLYLLFRQSSPKQIKDFISQMSPNQIASGILALQEEAAAFQAKFMAIFHGLKDSLQVEAIGKNLSSQQFLSALALFNKETIDLNKLSSLLVGISPHVFFETIYFASQDILEPLRREGLLEPLQHQLCLFVHEAEKVLGEYQYQIDCLHQEIEQIDHQNLGSEELHSIQDNIEKLKESHQNLLEAINKALAITWKTNRIDLIEKFNQLKEKAHSQVNQQIGREKSEHSPATGLFAALEQSLFSAYSSSISMQCDIESLSDDDLSIEALTKLSIWYLKDYWELGLLPSVKDIQELNLEHLQPYGKEWLQQRQYWFNLVQQNLERLNIGRVRDLKKANIFSKKTLKEYISQHNLLLT